MQLPMSLQMSSNNIITTIEDIQLHVDSRLMIIFKQNTTVISNSLSEPNQTNKGPGNRAAAIAGGVIGRIAAVWIIGGLIFWYTKCKQPYPGVRQLPRRI